MFSKILVPLDGSELAQGILCQVEELAKMAGAEVHLLYVVHLHQFPGALDFNELEEQAVERAQKYLAEMAAALQKQSIQASAHVRVGHPAEEILDHAKRFCDLVVMTTHGYGGIRRWAMGSVADQVMRRCVKPMLLFRADEECRVS
jgi:nucleotide-binding universal stress UspA family protein